MFCGVMRTAVNTIIVWPFPYFHVVVPEAPMPSKKLDNKILLLLQALELLINLLVHLPVGLLSNFSCHLRRVVALSAFITACLFPLISPPLLLDEQGSGRLAPMRHLYTIATKPNPSNLT